LLAIFLSLILKI